MRIDLDDHESIEPSMAPLLDCIFLLLIFFLVATSFQQQQQEENPELQQLAIQLPDSAASLSAVSDTPEPLVIAIDYKGKLYMNNKRLSVTELHQMLKKQAATNPDRAIRIDGDRNTPLQHIVHLMDLCEFEGLTHIALRAASRAEY